MKKILIPLICSILLVSATVISLPRLAVEHSLSCNNCHINPNGGGMRTEFGNHSVALNELVMPFGKKIFKDKFKSTRLSESARYGFDSRYLVFDNGRTFKMQTDLYLNLEPLKNFRYQLRFGEGPFEKTRVYESYALYQWEDEKYYLKAGRFTPAYGLRTDDHKAFTRELTGHGSGDYIDGVSVGAEFSDFYLVGELFNPRGKRLLELNLTRIASYKNLGYMIGASLQDSKTFPDSLPVYPDSKSFFGALSYDRFTLLGEVALVGSDSDTLLTYLNFTTRLEYGIYLIAEYNFKDADRNFSSGVDEFYRISLEIFPIPFVDIRPTYTIHTEGFLKDETDFFVQLHIGY